MRIGFAGKGGSGKSTMTALTAVSVARRRDASVVVIDADINMHQLGLLGGTRQPERDLSLPGNARAIREYLAGTNPRVSLDHMMKSTPPGAGSGLWSPRNLPSSLQSLTHATTHNVPTVVVGTYKDEEIGLNCYHGALGVLENVLSHANDQDDEWILVDLVAGTDAFASTMYVHFDAIIVAVEPTPESVEVALSYWHLAEIAGTSDVLRFVGNKIEDATDLQWIDEQLPQPMIGHFALSTPLKHARRNAMPIPAETIDAGSTLVRLITEQAHRSRTIYTPQRRHQTLVDLHLRLADQQWVRNSFGDVSTQVDPEWTYPRPVLAP
jgi:CO dehydrogenase maturation factor